VEGLLGSYRGKKGGEYFNSLVRKRKKRKDCRHRSLGPPSSFKGKKRLPTRVEERGRGSDFRFIPPRVILSRQGKGKKGFPGKRKISPPGGWSKGEKRASWKKKKTPFGKPPRVCEKGNLFPTKRGEKKREISFGARNLYQKKKKKKYPPA